MFGKLNKTWLKANIAAIVAVLVLVGAGIYAFTKENSFINTSQVEPVQVSFEAKITEAPDVRADKTVLIVQPADIAMRSIAMSGKVRVTTSNFTDYSYGEYILVEGELKKPENFADFDWVGYLEKEGISFVMHRPYITKTGKIDKDFKYFAAGARQNIYRGLQKSLLPPHSSLYSAMLIGKKSDLTQGQKDSLAQAGLSHIVAISGMHIALITYALFFVFLGAGFWRHHAGYLALAVLLFYILLIGAPASAVRAGVMASILVLAQSLGRPNSTWRALLYAAAIMAALNPLIVRNDIGFQLSFLAVAGILFLSPRLEVLFERLKIPKLWKGRQILGATISAQAFTFPLVFYNFGAYSAWSPVANILAVAALPFAVGAGFIAALGGMIGLNFLAGPAWIISKYIWQIVYVFG